jgi:hypothetical protein
MAGREIEGDLWDPSLRLDLLPPYARVGLRTLSPTMDRGELGRTTASVSNYRVIINCYWVPINLKILLENIGILNGATYRHDAAVLLLSRAAPQYSTQQRQGLLSLCMRRHCGHISLIFPAPGTACLAKLASITGFGNRPQF